MNMRKILLPSLTLLFSLFWSISSQALALTEIELLSYLNQTLRARITLLSVTAEEAKSLRVSVSQTESAALGLKFINLRHEIKQDEQGYYIEITSQQAIVEPVVSIKLELDWNQGRLSREYALLIDPASR